MALIDLIKANRSYRKFKAGEPVSHEQLKAFVGLTRFTPSSKNRQPLKYILVSEKEDADFVFSHLKWAWYLRDWDGPTEHERPPAYLIMLLDNKLNDKADFDAGIAAQTILLAATEQGLGGCIIRTVNRYELARYFNLSDQHEIILVIALGVPDQEVIIEAMDAEGHVEYWQDAQGRHHVPKRSADTLIYHVKP